MLPQLNQLRSFRQQLFQCFRKRADTIVNLLDAISSHAHRCHSVVQLSEATAFERQYSSITDAIADGLPHADWKQARQTVYDNAVHQNHAPNIFILDATPNPRPYAYKLNDRTITHYPNPAPGNKPICIGHAYSLIALLPRNQNEQNKHWIVPLSMQRVTSDDKSNEFGMQQLNQMINELGLQQQLSISIGDSLYGTENCRQITNQQTNLVHIFRLAHNRNVYNQPSAQEHSATKRGRKKAYGKKIKLSQVETLPPAVQQASFQAMTKKGRTITVTVKQWNNKLLRGSRHFRAHEYPINIIQVTLTDENNHPIFLRPLWLAVCGQRRHEITLVDVYQHYLCRYDIEHFFRFSKRNLLMDAYQTPDTSHEENWWQLTSLAYVQLYLANTLAAATPKPWEKYLPEYQQDKQQSVKTPSQTQRAYSDILKKVGTPAAPSVPRGKPCGRLSGTLSLPRPSSAVIFKSKQMAVPDEQTINTGSEKADVAPNPQLIARFLSEVKTKLVALHTTPEIFAAQLLNSS